MTIPALFNMTTQIGFSFSTPIHEDAFRFSKSANFNEVEIMGRSSPIITYSNSSAMTLDVNLQLFASLYQNDQITDIDAIVSSFLSLTFPMTPGVQPPSLCTVSIGTILQNWKCVCSSVDVDYGLHNLWDESGKAQAASLDIKFLGIEINNVPASQYLKTRNFAQISTGLG